jgi:uncharacterized protein
MSTFLTAEWRKLIMVQYAVAPETLMPYLPAGVELDLFQAPGGEARCYVSLVAFLFDKVRVKGLAVPWHKQFEEINLRFYVRRREADGTTRRGVVFIREFVPRWAIALVARRVYEEPYLAIRTSHKFGAKKDIVFARYAWQMGGRVHSLSATGHLQAQPIVPGSEEEFVTEHYWGYTKRKNGSTSVYEVQHPRWQTYRVQSYEIEADFGVLYGPAFAFLGDQPVSSVLFAEGSAVTVRSGTALSAESERAGA